jgi:DNA-binding LacI/PurR family transcriptional regulator
MATIYDITKAVGVAKSTVANALSGKGTVSEATRQLILQCAQEMGYRLNVVARSLYSHKTFTLALILSTIANPFYPEIAEAVEHIAREHEYHHAAWIDDPVAHLNAGTGTELLEGTTLGTGTVTAHGCTGNL